MKLNISKKLVLQNEIKLPENKDDGFSDNEVPASTKILAQNDESSKAAFAVVSQCSDGILKWLNEEETVLPFP